MHENVKGFFVKIEGVENSIKLLVSKNLIT